MNTLPVFLVLLLVQGGSANAQSEEVQELRADCESGRAEACLELHFTDQDTLEPIETIRPSALDTLLQASLSNLKIGIHMERTLRPFLRKLKDSTL